MTNTLRSKMLELSRDGWRVDTPDGMVSVGVAVSDTIGELGFGESRAIPLSRGRHGMATLHLTCQPREVNSYGAITWRLEHI